MLNNKVNISDTSDTPAIQVSSMGNASSILLQNESYTLHDRIIENFKKQWPVDSWRENGYFDDDYLNLINTHWLQFLPPSHSSHYILASCYFFIMMIGCSGNVLVIILYLRCRSLQTKANILIMNLAISDFLQLVKTPVFIYNSLYFGPIMGSLGCQIYGFFGGLGGTVSITTLASIALDRYYVVAYPLDPLKTTKKRVRIWISFLWMYGAFFSSLPLLNTKFNRYVPEGYLTSCSFDYLTDDVWSRGFILVFFSAAWIVPFSIITFCYIRICMIVVKSGMSKSRHAEKQKKKNIEMRLSITAMEVIGLWFVSWTPYAIIALLGIFGYHEYITPLSSMIPALFCKTASCVDPYIYSLAHPRFKRELIKLFCYSKEKTLNRSTLYEQPVWRTRASRNNIEYKSESGTLEGGHLTVRAEINDRYYSEPCFQNRYQLNTTDKISSRGYSDIPTKGDRRFSQRKKYTDDSSTPENSERYTSSRVSFRNESSCKSSREYVGKISRYPATPKNKKKKKTFGCWYKKSKVSTGLAKSFSVKYERGKNYFGQDRTESCRIPKEFETA